MGEEIKATSYQKKVEKACEGKSRQNLIQLILQLIEEVPGSKKNSVLQWVLNSAPPPAPQKILPSLPSLLTELSQFKKIVCDRVHALEKGSYFDLYDDWVPYYDEEPDLVSEEQLEKVEFFFREADRFFFAGYLQQAGDVYGQLFTLLASLVDVEGFYFGDSISLRQERARYCRCLYERCAIEDRANELLKVMLPLAPLQQFQFDLKEETEPFLSDVYESLPNKPNGWQEFLPQWKEILSPPVSERSSLLLMEVTYCLEGSAGVAALARSWKQKEPRGYLYWVQMLRQEKDWAMILEATQEAFQLLSPSPIRKQLSHYFLQAADKLGVDQEKLVGRREHFFSSGSERDLLLLLEEANKRKKRSFELKQVMAFYHKSVPGLNFGTHIKILLMAGHYQKAFHLGKKHFSDGYPVRESGLLLCSTLLLLVELNAEAKTTFRCFHYFAQQSMGSSNRELPNTRLDFSQELITGLKLSKLTELEKEQVFKWAQKTGKQWIEDTLERKQRDTYSQAAEVLIALMEIFVLLGCTPEATQLLEDYFTHQFKRYNAFQREVHKSLQASPLLQQLGIVWN